MRFSLRASLLYLDRQVFQAVAKLCLLSIELSFEDFFCQISKFVGNPTQLLLLFLLTTIWATLGKQQVVLCSLGFPPVSFRLKHFPRLFAVNAWLHNDDSTMGNV